MNLASKRLEDQALCQRQRFVQIMRHKNDGARFHLLQAEKLLLDFFARDRIEGAERTIVFPLSRSSWKDERRVA